MTARIMSVVALFVVATAASAADFTQSFGMVGIADGQTARLNAVLVAPPEPERGNSDPVVVHLQFFDADGNVLTESNVRLTSGHAQGLEWAGRGGRMEIRGAGLFPPGPCRVILSLEIFDNVTGRTQIALYPPGPCKVEH